MDDSTPSSSLRRRPRHATRREGAPGDSGSAVYLSTSAAPPPPSADSPPGSSAPDATAGAPDPYARFLSPAGQQAYRESNASSDLTGEIRLMRAILALLSTDPFANHQFMARALSVLLRAITVQLKSGDDAGTLDEILREAGDRILDEYQEDVE